jgi:YopX protein
LASGRQCSFWSSDSVLGNRPVSPPALPISPDIARGATVESRLGGPATHAYFGLLRLDRMRNIRFRVYLPRDGSTYPVERLIWDENGITSIYANGAWFRPGTVQLSECTGVKDLADNEIYEDDVVIPDAAFRDGRQYSRVVYKNGKFVAEPGVTEIALDAENCSRPLDLGLFLVAGSFYEDSGLLSASPIQEER